MKLKLNNKMAELVGAIIGDGCLYNKKYQYLLMLSGNIREDRKYYDNISRFLFKTINKKPTIKIHQRALRLIIQNKTLFNFFYGYLGMRYDGNKTYKVKIPFLILKNLSFTKACLRGIVDTDGSVFTSDKPGSSDYPSIEITTVSKNLAFQIKNILKKLNYRVTLRWYDPKNNVQVRTYKIGLNGWSMLRKWCKEIGFSHSLKANLAASILKKKYGEAGVNFRKLDFSNFHLNTRHHGFRNLGLQLRSI